MSWDCSWSPAPRLRPVEARSVGDDLVAHSADGHIETVKYQLLDSMLLNEVQRQEKVIGEQKSEIGVQEGQIRAQKDQIRALEELLARLEALIAAESR